MDQLRHRQGIGARGLFDADEDRRYALVERGRVVVLGPQLDGRHVTQAHQGLSVGAQDQVTEVLHPAHVRIGAQVHGEIAVLEPAHPGEIVVAHQDGLDVRGRHPQGRHAPGVQPDPHGEGLVADQPRLGHPRDGLELWLDHPQQVVGDLGLIHVLAVEGHVHQGRGIARGGVDDRVLGLPGQDVALARHLGLDLRHRRLGVVVEDHVGLDGGLALNAGGGQVIDPRRLGHRLLQGGGDEGLDQVAAGPRVAGGDGHHRVLGLRVLAHLHGERGSAGPPPGSAG